MDRYASPVNRLCDMGDSAAVPLCIVHCAFMISESEVLPLRASLGTCALNPKPKTRINPKP